MNINYINTGSSPNSGDGDSIRAAFTKVNSNFTEVVNTITNLVVSPGSIGPTGPTGPAGTSSINGIVNNGTVNTIPIYTNTTTLSSSNILSIINNNLNLYNTSTQTTFKISNQQFNISSRSILMIEQCYDDELSQNITFLRSKGSLNSKQSVENNVGLGNIVFTSYKDNNYFGTAIISVKVKNSSLPQPSGVIDFAVNTGTGFIVPLKIDADDYVKLEKISELTTGSNINIVNNLVPNSDLSINFGTTNKRWDQAFINTLNISSSIKFPDGTEQTTAGGSGGSFAPSRTISDITTPAIANDEAVNVTMSGFPGFIIYKISTSHAAWVRIYINDSARTADSTRTESEDPRPDAGVITEVLTTQSETILLTPAVYGFTDPASNDLSVSIVNKSGSSTAITVSMVLVQTEA